MKNIDFIETLPPGLHEMVIIDKGKKEGIADYDVNFIERSFKDIMALNEGKKEMEEENKDFRRVAVISELNDRFYNNFLSHWIKMIFTETSAEIMKQLHLLRVKKYIYSEKINPLMEIFKTLSPVGKQSRILQIDENKALESLTKLIKTKKERKTALIIAKKIVLSGKSISNRQKEILSRISKTIHVI